jgi:hypothetical protein
MISKTPLRQGWTLAVALLVAAPALAQREDQTDQYDQQMQQDKPDPVFSLHVSPQLLLQGVDLLVEKRLTKDYGFDEFQAEEMRLLLYEEVPKFLAKHQAELETLATEWLEAASAPEPPTAEFAANWAARLRPIVEDAEVTVDRVSENMREFLNDDQQVMLEGFQAGIKVATGSVKGRLYEFEQGHFDPDKDWVGNRNVRHRGPEEIKALEQQMDLARRGAMGETVERAEPPVQTAPPPPRPPRVAQRPAPSERKHELVEHETPAVPQPDAASTPAASAPAAGKPAEKKDEWTLYVEAFIKRYTLDDEQQQKAQHFLQRAHADRDLYYSRKGAEIERITRMFTNAKNEKERNTAEKAYARLQRPLDGMFERLKRDLETLPTRAQRRDAAKSGAEQSEPGKPERKDAAGKPPPK